MPIRWLLHPVTTAVALSLLVVVPTAAASHGELAGALLLLVAGTAAGFANSGST